MDLSSLLIKNGQEHILPYIENEPLKSQLEAISWNEFPDWVENYVINEPDFSVKSELFPAPYYPAEPESTKQEVLYKKAYDVGAELLKDGKVAAFTVAGGQGTRLGYNGPKGTYPVSPIKNKTLFQLFADRLKGNEKYYGHAIPWYIMTSPLNHEATESFFKENNFFGLNPKDVMFFQQGQMPAFSFDGKLFLASKESLAMSPDGHGGSLKALQTSGALADMKARGVEYMSYFQVDNPLVSVVDATFIGLHHLDGSQMSNRMLAKREPFEKLGLFCIVNDKLQVIEYSDLPDELAVLTDDSGKLKYLAGSPAIHVISRTFIEEINEGTFSLPFHRAVKKIPHIDTNGVAQSPSEPNGVKLETFVFDSLPLASETMTFEAKREDEFGPVKNPDGEDSPVSCRKYLQEMAARWLTAQGTTVARHEDGSLACELEIDFASYPNEKSLEDDEFPAEVKAGESFYITK
ncbi:MAG: UDPGP type 1 family protein [Lentisphaeria bacterium]|nr:UDPGP type 1 family protein [Lentisphaeria bacterium]